MIMKSSVASFSQQKAHNEVQYDERKFDRERKQKGNVERKSAKIRTDRINERTNCWLVVF